LTPRPASGAPPQGGANSVEASGISTGETTISIIKAVCYAPFRGQAAALREPGVVSSSSDIYFMGRLPLCGSRGLFHPAVIFISWAGCRFAGAGGCFIQQ